jgi:hypothetical protein
VHRKKRSDAGTGYIAELIDEIKKYFKTVGEVMPHMTVTLHGETRIITFLPSGLYTTKKQTIIELRTIGIIPDGTPDSTVYNLWNSDLWEFQIRDWQPFCKCDVCCTFKTAHALMVGGLSKGHMEAAQDPTYLKMKGWKEGHLAVVLLARNRYQLRYELARAYPDTFLHICIDGMDNQKTNLPHCNSLLKSKEVDGAGLPLQTKLLGVLIEGRGFMSFMTLPTIYQGANVTWTAFLHVLHKLQEHDGRLPPVLLLQLDNCGRDNKNQLTFAFLGWLVHLGVFHEVQMNFLPVGHTHCEIDQHFSVISQNIKPKDLLEPDHLLAELKPLFADDGPVREDMVLSQVLLYPNLFVFTKSHGAVSIVYFIYHQYFITVLDT